MPPRLTFGRRTSPPTCPTDPTSALDAVGSMVDAGFDQLAFVQIGDDQDGFFRFWEHELQPALAEFA